MGRDYVDSIKCSSCDVAFSSGNIYIQHYQAKHGDFPPEYIDREKFICDQVGIPFPAVTKRNTDPYNISPIEIGVF